jgi:hypothetical protein
MRGGTTIKIIVCMSVKMCIITKIIVIIIIIPSNRPDITFMNKTTKSTFLIDIAVPNTHNLAKIKTEKQEEYRQLGNEISVMWKQTTVQVIPIVISTTGVIPKSLSQSLKRINLHPNTYKCKNL